MLVDQAIFTSLPRRGKSGYHVVARSPGVTEAEATALASWCPSHGGLAIDGANRVSVNFHPLPSGRFAVSRTCEGRPEYSGRGARQVYTHAVVFDHAKLEQAGHRPFAVYRDALALGHLHYRADPEPSLKAAKLSSCYPPADDREWDRLARAYGRRPFEAALKQIDAGQAVVVAYGGDRAALVEALASRLGPEGVAKTSFATSLHPSSVRPFRVSAVAPAAPRP